MKVQVCFREYDGEVLVNHFERMVEKSALKEIERDGYTLTKMGWREYYLADREVY